MEAILAETLSTASAELLALESSAPVLVVSPERDDFTALRRILKESFWNLRVVHNLECALDELKRHSAAIVISERDLGPWSWHDLKNKLDDLSLRPEPRMIVACHGADEELWADVLSRGCYDLLIKPFAEEEVSWTVGYAWEEWKRELQRTMGNRPQTLGAIA